jgi:D-3-phosphoglycerate dehydrogenase
MVQYRVMLQMPYTPGIASVFDRHPEISVEQFTETSEANIVQHIGNYDAAILGVAPFTPAIIERADRLKIVARHGVGYDAVNVPALTAAGIPLAVVGIANSITVAEHSLFFMMALAKRAFLFDREARKGNWDIRRQVPAYDLAGRSVLVLGYGRIGRRLVPMLNAMQMQVFVYDPYVIQDAIATGGATPVEDFRAILGEMDFVSVNCPKDETTTGMIGKAEIEAMKPTAFLVNTARGGIIDEADLYDCLKRNVIAGAGIDPFVVEPPSPDHPLFTLDNIIV